MGEPGKHAICSPSGAAGWLNCTGWTGGSGKGSKFANEGSAAHQLMEMALTNQTEPHDFIGTDILVEDDTFTVDQDMADHVKVYTDIVRRFGAPFLVEQKLPVGLITGEEGATGTADTVLFDGDTLTILDLKYGMGVPVSAYQNEQLMIYALAALEEYDFAGPFEHVSLWIIQPRIDYITDWKIPVAELYDFRTRVYEAAQRKLKKHPYWNNVGSLNPGEKTCRWCAKKATCPALANFVFSQITDDFVDLDKEETIAPRLQAGLDLLKSSDNEYIARYTDDVLGMIEMFVKAVRAKIESEIFAGRAVRGWKLVAGRKGSRAWSDAEAAETTMKAMRLKADEMYTKEIISPTAAEKLLKETPRRWKALEKLITQKEGKPSVAPEGDKRPAIALTPVENDFADLTQED